MIKPYLRAAGLLLLGLVLLLTDFVSKAYVYHLLSSYGLSAVDLTVFRDWFGIDFMITLAMNRGAAWGFFSNFQILLLVLRIVMIVGMFIYLFFFNQRFSQAIPFVMIIAGALGNVVDFFLYGSVVDFLHFNLWGYHFPVFNFADSCITLGVFWLLIATSLRRKGKNYAGV